MASQKNITQSGAALVPGNGYGRYADVAVCVKSKRINVDVAAPSPEAVAGAANCHCRAAFRARFAKKSLDAGVFSSAEDTVPSGLSRTRTLTRTVPDIVERALSETSGSTLRTIAGADALSFAGAPAGSSEDLPISCFEEPTEALAAPGLLAELEDDGFPGPVTFAEPTG